VSALEGFLGSVTPADYPSVLIGPVEGSARLMTAVCFVPGCGWWLEPTGRRRADRLALWHRQDHRAAACIEPASSVIAAGA